ncbi:MAG TPA: hypothetical protein VD866_14265 [Urbifossiella sp.]|nr:hypothetical protein [Urbifossiella sp.]
MAVPLFFAGGGNWLEEIALGCLAVAGGYLAGYLGGGFAGWALDRWVFKKPSPEPVRKLVRIVCGVGVAILVFWIVFHNRGTGGGSGDGVGKGSGSPTDGTGKGDPPKAEDKRPPSKVEPPKAADVDTSIPQVRVTFLGGDAVQVAARPEDSKLYYIGDEPVLRTFAEVKAAVEAKQRDAAGRQVLLVVVYPADTSRAADERGRTVSQVTEWAERTGVRVVLGTGTK